MRHIYTEVKVRWLTLQVEAIFDEIEKTFDDVACYIVKRDGFKLYKIYASQKLMNAYDDEIYDAVNSKLIYDDEYMGIGLR